MPNFQDSKIYKIHSYQTDKIYIGSTTQSLCRRFSNHKSSFKRGSRGSMSKEILKYDDSMITLIESYSCNNKNELEKRERYHIENNNCVNKCIPTRTKKEYDKQYRINNNNKIIKYRIDNKDKKQQLMIKYRNDNQMKLKDQVRQYQINNKDTIKQYQKQYGKYRNSHFGILCKSYGIFN